MIDVVSLTRLFEKTGMIVPLMVWNVNALILKSLTGISATAYAPYAVLCYLSPIITIVVSYRLKEKYKPVEA